MNWESLYYKLINERICSNGERHHIIPKSLGGSDDSDNIVILSHRNHTLAHYIRYRWLGEYQDRVAYKMMCGQLDNPMFDSDLYSKFVERMQSKEIREMHSISATEYWKDQTNRDNQSERRLNWISKNNISGDDLTKHLNTPEMIERNKGNFKKWKDANPDKYEISRKKAHKTTLENNKNRTAAELKSIYSRGSGISNPNWGGYVIITNGKESLVYDDWSDAKKAPVGVNTLQKCNKDDMPIWFGKYKGYSVYRSKEMV